MLKCLPSSVISWNFRVVTDDRVVAEITFDFLTEQGAIVHRGRPFAVTKHGPMSGRWSLIQDGVAIATAEKPSAFQRRFEMQTERGKWFVEAKSTFGRGFELLCVKGNVVGEIRPTHLFGREAAIECDPALDEQDQLFAFWLVALAWRRQAQSD